MNKILVAIPMAEDCRHEFFKSFYAAIALMPEQGNVIVETTKWANTVNARNSLVKSFLKGDCTHLFFMDSDMEFPPNTLSRLLEHDKYIVAGFYTRKLPPFASVIFKGDMDDWTTWNPTTEDRLQKCSAVGTGCMLIKRNVLETMEWPWFSYEKDLQGKEKYMSEDVVFCINAKKNGFDIWVDPTLMCGHVGNFVIRPFLKEGILKVSVDAV